MRRWLGAFCLAVAAGLLIWGQTVLKPHLKGTGFVLYWIVCFLFTIAAIVISLLDMRATRIRARKEHRALVEKTMKEVDPEFDAKTDHSADSNSPAEK